MAFYTEQYRRVRPAARLRYKGGVRIVAYAALFLAALALPGCGSNDGGNGSRSTWTADSLVDVDNATLVTEFNAYAEAVDESWERTPVTVVTEMFRLDSSENPNVSVISEAPAEAAEEAIVTVTYSRLLDDSVEATRNSVRLQRVGDVWHVEHVEASVRCRPGRGHREFSAELCA